MTTMIILSYRTEIRSGDENGACDGGGGHAANAWGRSEPEVPEVIWC